MPLISHSSVYISIPASRRSSAHWLSLADKRSADCFVCPVARPAASLSAASAVAYSSSAVCKYLVAVLIHPIGQLADVTRCLCTRTSLGVTCHFHGAINRRRWSSVTDCHSIEIWMRPIVSGLLGAVPVASSSGRSFAYREGQPRPSSPPSEEECCCCCLEWLSATIFRQKVSAVWWHVERPPPDPS